MALDGPTDRLLTCTSYATTAVNTTEQGYSALGTSRPQWRSALGDHYRSSLPVGRGQDGEFCTFDTGALAFFPTNASSTDCILETPPVATISSSSYGGATTTTTTKTKMHHRQQCLQSSSSSSSPSLSLSSSRPVLTRREQRDLAATSQAAFEDAVLDLLEAAWAAKPSSPTTTSATAQAATAATATAAASSSFASLSSSSFSARRKKAPLPSPASSPASYDGIVLTGGCALNVLANSRVQRSFRPALPVHIAAAPSDCGLAVSSLFVQNE